MTKFKVGDQVRIRKNLVPGNRPKKGGQYINKIMCRDYAGKIATVSEAANSPYGACYKLYIDDGEWTWYDRCLRPAFTWKRFKKGKVAVRITSKAAGKNFLKQAEAHGLTWFSGHRPTEWRPDKDFTGYKMYCHTSTPGEFIYCLITNKPVYEWSAEDEV